MLSQLFFRLNRNTQWKQASNQGNNQTNRRRWRGGIRTGGEMDTGDLRISVENNLFRVSIKSVLPAT